VAVVTTEPAAAAVQVVLALGANLGDRAATLRQALRDLDAEPGVRVLAVSAPVETDPVGGPEQPDYLNAVAVAEVTVAPAELLAACHRVEQRHGRERQVHWGARTLDVDVVAFGAPGDVAEVVSDDPALTLPHPRAHQRGFVLVPWAQLRPDAVLRLPDGSSRPVADLLADTADGDLAAGVRASDLGSLW
jgi:dihydroneopterin aldolase/2-amino-4-hydroxy-6-hydroxymethyldihydropteridine diphosphokinase